MNEERPQEVVIPAAFFFCVKKEYSPAQTRGTAQSRARVVKWVYSGLEGSMDIL